MSIQRIYERRFIPDIKFRDQMWKILCKDYFQQYISDKDIVLEVGAGFCEFINNINCGKKFAVDVNPDIEKYASDDVEVIISQSNNINAIYSNSIDVVFISNFFEHLKRRVIVDTVLEIFRILKVGGKLIILQPNIRFAYRDYWMFFDHITPIDDRALVELLEINNFKIIKNVTKFLPYTTKSRLPRSIILVRLYLTMKFLWSIFGKQSLIIAEK